jgi:hypothetical protein
VILTGPAYSLCQVDDDGILRPLRHDGGQVVVFTGLSSAAAYAAEHFPDLPETAFKIVPAALTVV